MILYVYGGNRMKKVFKQTLSIAVMVVMLFCFVPLSGFIGLDLNLKAGALDLSGQCGDNVYWSFDKNSGALTIKGDGDMYDEYYSPFSDDFLIKSLVIEEGVTSIANNIFDFCEGLAEITLPSSIEYISDGVFKYCLGLTRITVDENNTTYCSDEYGVLYNKNKTNLIQYPVGNNRMSFIIPNGVESINDCAFYGCVNLKSIIIPDSIKDIGKQCFSACTDLMNIHLPDNKIKIDNCAFDDTGYYNNYDNWENGVLYIGKHLIAAKASLYGEYSVKNETVTIAGLAFESCANLITLNIPSSVKEIEVSAFYNCTNLSDIYYDGSAWDFWSIYKSGEVVLHGYNYYNSICVYTENDDYSITDLHFANGYNSGYCGDDLIWSFDFNDLTKTLKIVGDGEMYSDFELEDLYGFWGYPWDLFNTEIENLEFEGNFTVIPYYAFRELVNLKCVNIPESVKKIDDAAFMGCTSLTKIIIPDSVIDISYNSFDDTGYYNNPSNWKDGVLYIGNYLIAHSEAVPKDYQVKEGTKVIARDAFAFCNNLESIILPDGLKTICNLAFFACDNLKKIVIPSSVEDISPHVFWVGYDGPNDEDLINKKVVIYCYKDSYAHKYVIDNKLNYMLIVDEPELYTITYNGNGGINIPAEQIKEKDTDTTLSTQKPIKGGYQFVGWSTDKNATSAQYVAGAKIIANENLTLYAVWQANSYTVEFYDDSTLLGTKKLKYDEAGTLSYGEIPIKKGYKFVGWSTFSGGPALFGNGQSIKGLAKDNGAVVSYYTAWEKLEDDVLADSATGIVIDVPSGTYNDVVTLKVEKVLSGSAFDIIENQVNGIQASVFSIETYVNGVKTQPDGNVTVKIPVPSGLNASKCKLYYVNTDEQKTYEIAFMVKDGFIVFTTNHFSDWAIVETKGKVESVLIYDMELNYKAISKIDSKIEIDNGVNYTAEYKSSDIKIATVDKNGNIYGLKKGNSTITCTVTDEYGNSVFDTCTVNVKYAWWQWIIIIALFGWIWY